MAKDGEGWLITAEPERVAINSQLAADEFLISEVELIGKVSIIAVGDKQLCKI